MLCVADRGFFSFALWQAARVKGADLVWRVESHLLLPCEQRLPDGSYLSHIFPSQYDRRLGRNGQVVRVVEYRAGWIRGQAERIRLITTVLDAKRAPAPELAALYHERWEIENTLDELKTHLRGRQIVLRSQKPELVEQEFYGLLLAHFAIRGLMHEAAQRENVDPDTLSFVHSFRVVKRKLPAFLAISPSAAPCAA
jgi:IS4 transposase